MKGGNFQHFIEAWPYIDNAVVFSNCAYRGAYQTFQVHLHSVEGRTNRSLEGVEQVPGRGAVGDESANPVADHFRRDDPASLRLYEMPRAVRFNREYLLDVNVLVAPLDARHELKDRRATVASSCHHCCHCPGDRRPRLAEPQHSRPVRQEQAHDDRQGTRCIEPPKRAIHFPSAENEFLF